MWERLITIWEQMGEHLQNYWQVPYICWSCSQTGLGHVLKEEHLYITPSQRAEGRESENLNQATFLCLNSCILNASFPPVFFLIVAFSLYLSKPMLLHLCSQPKFSFSIFACVCCYQQVRCWNENLAGHCVDDK